MKTGLITTLLTVLLLVTPSAYIYAGNEFQADLDAPPVFESNLAKPGDAKLTKPKVSKRDFIDQDDTDYYFLSSGKKKIFRRIKNNFLIFHDKKRRSLKNISDNIKTRFGTKLDIIKDHSFLGYVRFKIKKGEKPKDIVAAIRQSEPTISFISPVLTSSKMAGEIAVSPNIIVKFKGSANPGEVIEELKNYNLSLVSKLVFSKTEYEFKIEESISDIGRIFELTREVAALLNIDWAEPNFLVNSEKTYTPNDPNFVNQWHWNNTGQNGAAADSDIDAVEGWDTATARGAGTVISVYDD